MSLDFYLSEDDGSEIFWANITHNLTTMAALSAVYAPLWHPHENGFNVAGDIIEHLRDGVKRLESEPGYFEQFNSPNGWGTHEHFVPFVKSVLAACEAHPKAKIRVSV